MQLPNNYLPVLIHNNQTKNKVGFGIVDQKHDKLLLLTPNDGWMEYNKKEIFELFNLFNPDDGCEYDLKKILKGN